MNYVGYSAKYLKIEDFYTKLALIAHNCYQAISKTPDEIFIKNLIKVEVLMIYMIFLLLEFLSKKNKNVI